MWNKMWKECGTKCGKNVKQMWYKWGANVQRIRTKCGTNIELLWYK